MKAEGRTTAGDERNSSAGIAKSTYSSRTESKREGERERVRKSHQSVVVVQ